MKCFVTGGAGYIGSHIVDRLINDGHSVTVYDNLSTGFELFVSQHKGTDKFSFVKGDLLDMDLLHKSLKDHDMVFHLAANADVRGGIKKTSVDVEQNILATHNVLECMREHGIGKIMFSSSATVYGEPDVFPTPETYAGIQTSLYGASKMSAEGLIEAYCEYYDMQSWIFRFVSFIGERYTHGVVFDFVKKLLNDTTSLEILGDGKQRKSYLDVVDGVDAIMFSIDKLGEKVNVVNLGHTDYVDVVRVADIICDELRSIGEISPGVVLGDVNYHFTGGVRGWKGDSPFVHLDTSKISSVGWKPTVSIEEGIRKTVRYLMQNKELLTRDVGGK